MINYATYDATTGRINSIGQCELADIDLQKPWGSSFLAIPVTSAATYNGHYIDVSADPHVCLARPTLPDFDTTEITADGIDTATLDVGEAFTVTIDDVDIVVTDGSLEITAASPASFAVRVVHWPYLTREWTVNAS